MTSVRGFRSLAFAFVLVFVGPVLGGCARQPQVQADSLPLRHVVIYRNGVGYFERGGHVEDSQVHFKMKEAEVGDFLATLAVMERGGSSVRAAAFPLDVDDDVVKADPDDKEKKPVLSEDERRGLKKIALALDGKAHDLEVGYIASAPVWKASYRLVVHDDGQADLQAWGIVENLSGEDWKDVKLSLVAGAPLSFEAQLGEAVVPTRPTVTDQGEVIAVVPGAETSLSQEAPATPAPVAAAPPPPPAPAPIADDKDEEQEQGDLARRPAPKKKRDKGVPGAPSSLAHGGMARPRPEPAPQMPTGAASTMTLSAPRDLRSLAAVALEAGTTRYDLPDAVTVPDKSATMVMLLSRKVPGESSFLFAPEGGVPDSEHHPFRVARFANKTGGTLERGPIAVFEEGSFLGQGMVDPLPEAATATVPFALERSLAIDSERKYDELGERVHRIENGELTIDRDAQTKTTYKVRNGGDRAAKVLVKHLRSAGTRLVGPPAGTEDNVGTGAALIPSSVGPKATTELVVDERATLTRYEDWFSPVADNAVKAFLADTKSDRGVAAKLGAAWMTRKDILAKQDTRAKLQGEKATLDGQSEETRRNLRAIEKNRSAEALRAKLTARLGQMASRTDELTKQIVELDAKLAELGVQFKETVRDISWTAPAPAPGA